MMKLWEKGIKTETMVEKFTVGNDVQMDLLLAPFDILGSIAHARMLNRIDLINDQEMADIGKELKQFYLEAKEGKFVIEPGIEDVHSQIELELTRKLGETGKKIHTARSRNDQILLDLKMFIREEIQRIVGLTASLFHSLIRQSNEFKDFLMPGYTHLQIAMPSSFGLWFGAFAESLSDDMQVMLAAFQVANQNPLGSAAGYGSSFPVDRQFTTDLLGFESLHYNSMYAQMGRGKTERIVAFAMSSLAGTISKMANDTCLFTNQNFGFLEMPEEITTGSSIMPHKKNPDVFELLRARCNKIQTLPYEIDRVTANLPSGYFRDYQVIKESFLPAFFSLESCLEVLERMIDRIKPVKGILDKELYKYVFSVEEVNKLVMNGIPFREAYQAVARQIKEGEYNPDHVVKHDHEGSIGNLSNDKIELKMDAVLRKFNFGKIDSAYKQLLES